MRFGLRESLGVAGMVLYAVSVVGAGPALQSVDHREAQAVADNALLSKVKGVKYLGTFINGLSSLHRLVARYEALENDDLSAG